MGRIRNQAVDRWGIIFIKVRRFCLSSQHSVKRGNIPISFSIVYEVAKCAPVRLEIENSGGRNFIRQLWRHASNVSTRVKENVYGCCHRPANVLYR